MATGVRLARGVEVGWVDSLQASEIKAALYDTEGRPPVFGFVGGLGGRDVFPEEFEQIIERTFALAAQGKETTYEMIGVRE